MGNKQVTLSTVRNTIRLLQEFSKGEPELGITELSRRLGLTKSAVYRIVKTLEEEKVVYKNAKTNKYQLGLKMFEIGSVIFNEMEISQVAIPMIEKVKSKLAGDIHLATYDQGDIIYLLRLGQKKKTWLKIGRRIRSHTNAAGKLLLAFQEDEEIQRVISTNLEKYTHKTITCPATLLKELKKIRTKGYATSAEEFVENVYSIAVPIYNDSGTVIAAISLTRETPFPEYQTKEIVRELQLCSKLITENMGVNRYNDVL